MPNVGGMSGFRLDGSSGATGSAESAGVMEGKRENVHFLGHVQNLPKECLSVLARTVGELSTGEVSRADNGVPG